MSVPSSWDISEQHTVSLLDCVLILPPAVERWVLSGSALWEIYITELETICCFCFALWHSDLATLIETVQKNDQKKVGVFCSRLFYCVLEKSLFGLLVNIFSKMFLEASAQKLRITFWVSMSQKVFQVVLVQELHSLCPDACLMLLVSLDDRESFPAPSEGSETGSRM